MMNTRVRKHQIVKHVIVPVEVLEGLGGEPVVLVDPDKQSAGEERAVYGCMACNEPLSPELLHTNCPGEA